MSLPHWLVALVALQRLLELGISYRHTKRLLDQGAVEIGAKHYPLIVLLHLAWLAALWWTVPPDRAPLWPWVGVYVALECLRLWTMASLGRFWTTRVIHLPSAPLVRRGPYRFLRHPNYLIVVGEIAVVPLALGEWRIAMLFSLLNAAALTWRIRVENFALASRQ